MIEQPWIGQYQSEWLLRSTDHRAPKWLRVAARGHGTVGANGHAPQAMGLLADMLGRIDSDGVLTPDRDVRKHITRAVELGWLARGSSVRCLRVPAHSLRSAPGSPQKPCLWCG